MPHFRMAPLAGNHVENRRLFDAAAGSLRLDEWESGHVHTCQVCQGVFFVFINQQRDNPGDTPSDEPSSAAA